MTAAPFAPHAPPLAPYACQPSPRGRLHDEAGRGRRGPRTPFQRDRDRIVHSVAFRRLGHKTQVFIAPDGDHYRVRLTHSLEVAQIGRVIARQLGLDEDLTEALCLAHDIGHPPFGHAGEKALDAALAAHGGFDHNGHGLRMLMALERPYPTHDGLNLSWDLLEGMAKHNGPVAAAGWAIRQADAAFPLDLHSWPSLEAQVAAVADDIAYDNHDIDDGVRAGLLACEELLELPHFAERWRELRLRWPALSDRRILAELVRDQIGEMVNDVIGETRAALSATGVATVAEVRAAGRRIAGFSPTMAVRERALKRFMYDRLYHHPDQLAAAAEAELVILELFGAFAADPALMGEGWDARLPLHDPDRSRHIADYIAGMTDRYALRCHAALFGRDRTPAIAALAN